MRRPCGEYWPAYGPGTFRLFLVDWRRWPEIDGVGMLQPSTTNDAQARAAHERRLRLESMFRDYAPRMLDYARHRGATLVEAEDVVSEVFIVLTRRLDDAPAEVLPWLYGIARKVLGNQVRSKRRRRALGQRIKEEVSRERPAVSDAPLASARDILVQQALSRLSPKDREVLLLVAWDGLSYEEAARSLGCTSAAFAQMLRRARRHALALIEEIRTYDDTDGILNESEEL
jgi:RNA polymerase sigma-70 factor (ECF subfamily)